MFSKFHKKIGSYLAIFALILIQLVSFSLPAAAQSSNLNLSVGDSIDMYPGQTRTFTIKYSNAGDVDSMNNAVIDINIGTELVIDENSLTDQFPGKTQTYAVSSSLINKNSTRWGSVIKYQPGSANNPSAPSGTATPANLEIPKGQMGVFTLKATLKADIFTRVNTTTGVNYKIGDLLTPLEENQGIYSNLVFSGGVSQPGELNIRIVAAPSSNFAKPDSTKTSGGGFDGSKPQPVNSGLVFNPSTAYISEPVEVTASGFLDSATSKPLNNAACTFYLKVSPTNIVQATGMATNGVCKANFTGTQTPKTPGNYEAAVKVMGPNGELYTKPYTIQFIARAVAAPVLPRTGGVELAAAIGGVVVVLGIILFFVVRKKKMKIVLR